MYNALCERDISTYVCVFALVSLPQLIVESSEQVYISRIVGYSLQLNTKAID